MSGYVFKTHRQASVVTHGDFIRLAKNFEQALSGHHGRVETSVQGAEITGASHSPDRNIIRTSASVTFSGQSLSDLDKNTWENLAISRICFYPSEAPGSISTLEFEMDKPFEINLCVDPAEHAEQILKAAGFKPLEPF